MRSTTFLAAALAATAEAAKDSRTFAVLRFFGDGPLMEGRVDPIVNPGTTAMHVHTIQGGSNIGISSTGEDLMASKCSTALIEGDQSAYWMPSLYFQYPETGLLDKVDLYYMNVYYFFEPTDDDIKPFPVGLQMFSGNASLRECPNYGGQSILDAGNENGTQPLQWTCPRKDYNKAAWPSAAQSDGATAGIQDPVNQGAGQGFPFGQCDGQYSPLRHDLHFPSCYDQSKALTDYENNMVFPTVNYATGKQNCPEGFLHVPHIFYEMYWNTQKYSDLWTPDQDKQPFVLSNGDLSGCSGHGDFLAAWDQATLANIIDTCDAGDAGMDQCPGVTVRDKSTSCTVASPIDEVITGNLTMLPGDNPLEGWGMNLGGGNASAAGGVGGSTGGSTGGGSSASGVASAADPTATYEKKGEVALGAKTASATTLSTSRRCVHTVTVTPGAAAETPAVKRAPRGHAHAHAHAARHHHSPHQG